MPENGGLERDWLAMYVTEGIGVVTVRKKVGVGNLVGKGGRSG